MFVVVAIEGNNHTIPIAFGLVVENNPYYLVPYEIRRSSEIGSCIQHVLSDSYQGYTSNSVFKYMLTRGFSGRTIQPLFWMTSNSYIVSDFEENFRLMLVKCLPTSVMRNDARDYFPNIRWNVVNIDVLNFFVLSVNQCNVPMIMLTEETRDYIQRTFDERRLMTASLTTVLTPYVKMMLHKRMQKFVRWQATKIPLEIPSSLPSDIYGLGIACGHAIATSRHLNVHELPDMVQIYYQVDVFHIAY
uniref:Uncharacterized protein n=1 Tax=Lactuca sativa TaxID=4236 RepID=A0A9R1V9D7_LACSA|nr:hypothetical protein LSAT_V11C600312100 [Lactuca sativa]